MAMASGWTPGGWVGGRVGEQWDGGQGGALGDERHGGGLRGDTGEGMGDTHEDRLVGRRDRPGMLQGDHRVHRFRVTRDVQSPSAVLPSELP